MDGALLVDKPSGPTSHDVVARVRRALHLQRVGHTGTLDPLATGLLVLLVGRATRLARFLAADEKEYLADVRLGASTPTFDAESIGPSRGVESAASALTCTGLTGDRLDAVLARFRGTFLQTPPPYSAKKVAGSPAYRHARLQQPVALEPVEVTVRHLERLPSDDPTLLRLRIVCGAGFYVRSLAHDIGRQLGCGAHVEALRRIRAGRLTLADAVPLNLIEAEGPAAADRLIPANTFLSDIPAVTLSETGLRRAAHGNSVAPQQVVEGVRAATASPFVRLLDADGRLVAIARPGTDLVLLPLVVLL